MKIGFDLWETLIKPNPLFKERKKDLFDRYNLGSHDVCEFIMRQIKSDLNKIIEDTGWQPDMETICRLFATRFGKDLKDMYGFYQDYQILFQAYPPILIDPHTSDLLRQLEGLKKDKKLNELIIVSNTMFINGQSLRNVLYNSLGIGERFEYMFFSDVMKFSKPNTKICQHQKFDFFIGDNPKTDGVFAQLNGAEFIQINTNNKNLKDVYDIIITKNR